MMKFQALLTMGLGGLFVIPAIVVGDGRTEGGLTAALDQTVAALDQLVGIRRTLEAGDPEGVPAILSHSEPPMAAGMERDAHLAGLRTDIGRLAAQLERMEGGSPTKPGPMGPLDGGAPAGVTKDVYVGLEGKEGTSSAHVGLDEAARQIIENIRPPVETAVGAQNTVTPSESLEPDGFVVDPVKLGRSYYLADRWAEGLEILKRIEDSPEASYWRGRCLEKLDRDSEAIAAYESVVSSEADDYLKDRAANDLEFLRWLVDFEQRAAKKKQGGSK